MFDYAKTERALLQVAQTLLRVNGRWLVAPTDARLAEVLKCDIRATVFDAIKLFRDVDGSENRLIGAVMRQLEIRAGLH